MRTFAVPNILTVCRLLAIPLVLYLILRTPDNEHYRYYALIVLIVQQATDVLDGFLARRIRRATRANNQFGQFMDPLADKVYIGSTYLALSYALGFPWWATLTFLGKDVFLLITWTLRVWLFNIRTVIPHPLGKAAVACQAFLIFAYLLKIPAMAIKWGTGITVLLTVLAGLWYCYSGFRDAWRQRKKELHATLSAD